MYLYLDIDGVLNTNDTVINAYGKRKLEGFQNLASVYFEDLNTRQFLQRILHLDRRYCKRLRNWIRKFKIHNIIICSSLRKRYTLDQIKLMFLIKGYPEIADIIIDMTPTDIEFKIIEDHYFFTRYEPNNKGKRTKVEKIEIPKQWLETCFLNLNETRHMINSREIEILYHNWKLQGINAIFCILDDDVANLRGNRTTEFLIYRHEHKIDNVVTKKTNALETPSLYAPFC